MISDVPWEGPIGAVRVGYIDGEFVINPTVTQVAASTLDLRMAGTADAILMVEAGADELPEDLMLEALKLGHEAMQPIIEVPERYATPVGQGEVRLHPGAVRPDGRGGGGCTGWVIVSATPSPRTPARKRSTRRWRDAKAALLAALGETYEPKALAPHVRGHRRRRSCASASWATRSAPTAATKRDPPDQRRGRHSPRATWQRPVHPRRDPGDEHHHTGHAGRCTAA